MLKIRENHKKSINRLITCLQLNCCRLTGKKLGGGGGGDVVHKNIQIFSMQHDKG